MDKQALEKFNDNILNEAIQRYCLENNTIKKIDICDSIIYSTEKNDREIYSFMRCIYFTKI